jgi:hypothetical protein
MKKGTKVELPLWLGEMLAVRFVICFFKFQSLSSSLSLSRTLVVTPKRTLDAQIDKATSRQLGTSPLVTLDLPSALSPRVINALKADPKTVDLRALASHFYGLGTRILELFEEEEMVEVLSEVFYRRVYTASPQLTSPGPGRPSRNARPRSRTTRITPEGR